MAPKCLLAAVLVITTVRGLHAAEPEFNAGQVVKATARFLEITHLEKMPLDDARSEAWLKSFLAMLDPRKVYFLQSDIEEFSKWKHSLDNYAKTGDMRFANYVRARYQKRVADAHKLAIVALDQSHDYTIDEDWPFPCESHTRTSIELADRWRLKIKGELLFEKAHRFSQADAKAFLRGRYDRIAEKSREMDGERLCEVYLNSLAAVYDPHSAYFTAELLAQGRSSLGRKMTTHIRWRSLGGRVLAVDIGPAISDRKWQDAIVGWELLAIGRLDGEFHHVVERPVHEVNPSWARNSDKIAVLELQHPVTMERKSIEWGRFWD